MAEVVKTMRCGNPHREAIERADERATTATMRLLCRLRSRGKEIAVVEKCVQIVLQKLLVFESLKCQNREDGVEQLARLLALRDVLSGLNEKYGAPVDALLQRFEDLMRENELLQEDVWHQQPSDGGIGKRKSRAWSVEGNRVSDRGTRLGIALK